MLATPQGYDLYENEINGETFAVQRNTGEVFGAHLQYIIDGYPDRKTENRAIS